MNKEQREIIKHRLSLYGNNKLDTHLFKQAYGMANLALPVTLKSAIRGARNLFNGYNAKAFCLIGKTVRKILELEYNHLSELGALSGWEPTDTEILTFSGKGDLPDNPYAKKVRKLVEELANELKKYDTFLLLAYVSLRQAQFYVNWLIYEHRLVNEQDNFDDLTDTIKIFSEVTTKLSDKDFFPNAGMAIVFVEIVSAYRVAVMSMANNVEYTDEKENLLKGFHQKKLIASETGRQAVIEGKWNPRDRKFDELKLEIDKLARQGLKHHVIAEKLIKRSGADNKPLCCYTTSGGIAQEIKFPAMKELIKSYFIESDRTHLISGRKNSV